MVNCQDDEHERQEMPGHETKNLRFSAVTKSSGSDEQLVTTEDTFLFTIENRLVYLYWQTRRIAIEKVSDLPYCDRVLTNGGEVHLSHANERLYKAWSLFLREHAISMEAGNFTCADAVRAGREAEAAVEADRLCPFVFNAGQELKGDVSFDKKLECDGEKRQVNILNLHISGHQITGIDDKTVVYLGGDHGLCGFELTAAQDEIYRTTKMAAIFNSPESGFEMRFGSGDAVLFSKVLPGVWQHFLVERSSFRVLGKQVPRDRLESLGEQTRWEAVYIINRTRVSTAEAHAAGIELADNYLLFPEIEKDGSQPDIDALRRADAHGVTISKVRHNSPHLGYLGSSEKRFFKAVKLLEILGSGPNPLLSAVAEKAELANAELHALMFDSDKVAAAVDSQKCFTLNTSKGWIRNDVLAPVGPWMDGRIVTLSSGGLYHTRKKDYLQTEVRGTVAHVSVTKEFVSTGLNEAVFIGGC